MFIITIVANGRSDYPKMPLLFGSSCTQTSTAGLDFTVSFPVLSCCRNPLQLSLEGLDEGVTVVVVDGVLLVLSDIEVGLGVLLGVREGLSRDLLDEGELAVLEKTCSRSRELVVAGRVELGRAVRLLDQVEELASEVLLLVLVLALASLDVLDLSEEDTNVLEAKLLLELLNLSRSLLVNASAITKRPC